MTTSARRPLSGLLLSVLIVVSASAQGPARRSVRIDPTRERAATAEEARALLERHRGGLGLGASVLSAPRTNASQASGRLLRAHHFSQSFAGIPVEDSDLVVLTDGVGKVLLAEAKTGAEAGAPSAPAITLAAAKAGILAMLSGNAPVTDADLSASLVFRTAAFAPETPSRLHLYWRIECEAGGDAADGRSLSRVLWVDAESAVPGIAYESEMTCGGDTEIAYVTNHLPPGDAGAAFAVEGQSDVEVMFFCAWGGTAGPIISGLGGAYSVPAGFTCVDPTFGPGAINVLGSYGSAMPDIDLWQGYGPLPAMGAAAGGGPGPGPFLHPTAGGVIFPVLPPTNPILGGAGGQVLHWHQALKDYLAAYPIFLAGATIEAEVDVPAFSLVAAASPANGLWRVRFGQAGTPAGSAASLANSASDTIILHELGHVCWWRATPAGVWWNPDSKAINEAVGDTLAMFVTDQPLIGHSWLGAGTGALRSGLNATGYEALDPEGPEHKNGEILMGSFWTMRQNLIATLGGANGRTAAKTLLLDWLTLFDDVDMDSSILAHLLVLDDDDGDLTNGTPNDDAIVGGFAVHAWPAADVALIGSGTSPIFGATFFDPDLATGRASKLALFVLDPESSAAPVVIVAGSPGAVTIPGLGTTAIDLALPLVFLVDGITPGAGAFPLFPASTDGFGVFRDREPIVPAWPAGLIIAMQAFVLDPAAPLSFRMSNGFNVALP